MGHTDKEFDFILKKCFVVFESKLNDYGASWRILRPISITDQIFIKAQRIRSIEDKKVQKVGDDIISEYIGIINYCIIALIQLELSKDISLNQENKFIIELYNKYFLEAKELMFNKNHDYDEAWRSMRVSSFTDIILMRILRIKQIEDNDGKTFVSEGIDSNYLDMINYSVFALIKLTI